MLILTYHDSDASIRMSSVWEPFIIVVNVIVIAIIIIIDIMWHATNIAKLLAYFINSIEFVKKSNANTTTFRYYTELPLASAACHSILAIWLLATSFNSIPANPLTIRTEMLNVH